jgi:lipoate-protein ligase A
VNVHHGIIKRFDYDSAECAVDLVEKVRSAVIGTRLQDIGTWCSFIESNVHGHKAGLAKMVEYLDEFLPVPKAPGP